MTYLQNQRYWQTALEGKITSLIGSDVEDQVSRPTDRKVVVTRVMFRRKVGALGRWKVGALGRWSVTSADSWHKGLDKFPVWTVGCRDVPAIKQLQSQRYYLQC